MGNVRPSPAGQRTTTLPLSARQLSAKAVRLCCAHAVPLQPIFTPL